jgi:hypothetical protein
MTDEELAAIEARWCERPSSVRDDCAALVAEVRRLRGLVTDAHDAGGDRDGWPACPWCGGEERRRPAWDCVGRRPIEHRHDCPAFMPDGAVR